jgi:hypothetical protein
MTRKKQPIADKKRPPISVKTDKRPKPATPEEREFMRKFWDALAADNFS